jgi:hypothetical protein
MFVKSTNDNNKKLCQKCNVGVKKTEFDADFESAEKSAKKLVRKSYQQKSSRKMEYFAFITVCKSFRP